jgi:hypothetical protein
MPQITSQGEALQIVDKLLRQMESRGCEPLAIVDSATKPLHDGWLFFYNSSEYLSTGNDQARLAGNGPIFIQKSGAAHQLPANRPFESSIAALRFKSSRQTQARLSPLHISLNGEQFAALHLYRRNSILHPIAATVNCVMGCALSGYTEPMPVLIRRCRDAIGELVGQTSPLRDEYVRLVSSYLAAVEAELESANFNMLGDGA